MKKDYEEYEHINAILKLYEEGNENSIPLIDHLLFKLEKIGYNNEDFIKRLSNIIIKLNKPYLSLHFLEWCDETDFKIHEQIILNDGGYETAYFLAANVKKSDFKACEQKVLEARSPEYSYKFAQLPGSNFEAHQQIVVYGAQCEFIYEFAQLPGANFKMLEQAMLFSSEEPSWRNLGWKINFAQLPGANFEAFQNAVLFSGSPDAYYYFVQNFPEANFEAFKKATLLNRNGNLEKLENAKLDSKRFNSKR